MLTLNDRQQEAELLESSKSDQARSEEFRRVYRSHKSMTKITRTPNTLSSNSVWHNIPIALLSGPAARCSRQSKTSHHHTCCLMCSLLIKPWLMVLLVLFCVCLLVVCFTAQPAQLQLLHQGRCADNGCPLFDRRWQSVNRGSLVATAKVREVSAMNEDLVVVAVVTSAAATQLFVRMLTFHVAACLWECWCRAQINRIKCCWACWSTMSYDSEKNASPAGKGGSL